MPFRSKARHPPCLPARPSESNPLRPPLPFPSRPPRRAHTPPPHPGGATKHDAATVHGFLRSRPSVSVTLRWTDSGSEQRSVRTQAPAGKETLARCYGSIVLPRGQFDYARRSVLFAVRNRTRTVPLLLDEAPIHTSIFPPAFWLGATLIKFSFQGNLVGSLENPSHLLSLACFVVERVWLPVLLLL
jgi:hypothetical protein